MSTPAVISSGTAAPPAAPAVSDVDHVPVLDIFRFCRVAANGRFKAKGLGALFSVDYASQVNIAQASIVTHSTSFHNRLVHSRRAIKLEFGGFINKSGHDHACRTTLQCDQHSARFKLRFVEADELILKINDPLAGSRHLADEWQTHLAVPANFLRLIRNGLVGIGNLERISGREPYHCFRTWRIRQRR